MIDYFADQVLELAPYSKEFTKSSIISRMSHSDRVRFSEVFDETYEELIKIGALEQIPGKHVNWVRMTAKGIQMKFAGNDPEEFTINRILKELYNSPNKRKFYSEILDDNMELFNFGTGTEMSRLLTSENLIIWLEGNEVWQLSVKGRRIVRDGGWIKHLESESQKKKMEENLKYYQFADARFRYYAFWFTFLFSLAGSIYSVIKILEAVSRND